MAMIQSARHNNVRKCLPSAVEEEEKRGGGISRLHWALRKLYSAAVMTDGSMAERAG